MKYTKLPNYFIKDLSFFQNTNKLIIKIRIFKQIIYVFKVKDIGILNVFSVRKIKNVLNGALG